MNIRGVTARDLTRALKEDGYDLKRTRGSHHVYSRPGRIRMQEAVDAWDTLEANRKVYQRIKPIAGAGQLVGG